MPYRLVCLDMDGVIFKGTNFWMRLHEAFNTLDEGKELTDKYLQSDYDRLVQEVVGRLWKGKDARPYHDLIGSLEYLRGVRETFDHLHKRGYMTAIISASSMDAARRVQRDYGVDHIFANELAIRDGKITGDFIWPIGAGKEKKAEIIDELSHQTGIPLEEIIYVGDSETDVEAFRTVGRAIAFNPTSKGLMQEADITIKSDSLAEIIPYIP